MGDGLGRGIKVGYAFTKLSKDFVLPFAWHSITSEPSTCYQVKLFGDDYLQLECEVADNEPIGYGN